MSEPKEILSTTDLLDYGPSYAGHEGEMQYRHALQQEFDKRVALEREIAELKRTRPADPRRLLPNKTHYAGRLYGLQEAAFIAGETSIGLAIYDRIKFIEANADTLADSDPRLAAAGEMEKALQRIADGAPTEDPGQKDGYWGNEDDAEQHGAKRERFFNAQIARAALAKYAEASR